MQSESFVVTVLSFWENQRFRSILGWGSPWRSDQFQNYTNIDGDISVDFNSSTKEVHIDCPEGWDWIDKEWSIDFTRTCGPCDHHGWYYGASFENLVSMSREKLLDGTVNNSSVFRRRRWIRRAQCKSFFAHALFNKRLEWVNYIRERIEMQILDKVMEFSELSSFETKRKEACDKIVAHVDRRLKVLWYELKSILDKLHHLIRYFREKAKYEVEKSKKLGIAYL